MTAHIHVIQPDIHSHLVNKTFIICNYFNYKLQNWEIGKLFSNSVSYFQNLLCLYIYITIYLLVIYFTLFKKIDNSLENFKMLWRIKLFTLYGLMYQWCILIIFNILPVHSPPGSPPYPTIHLQSVIELAAPEVSEWWGHGKHTLGPAL